VDTTALVWDVTGRWHSPRPRDAKGWDALVRDLSSDDAKKAFDAQRALAANGNLAVAQLTKRVSRVEGKSPTAQELAALVKGLDDDDPDVRLAAIDSLEEHGSAAEAVLLAALAGSPSVEVKRSATALLERIRRSHFSAESLRAVRAVEVLEWIGTAEARRLLS